MGSAPKEVRIFLIRHGETVDNIAQVYAGSRDSELTNHGHQQATRLGWHFRSSGIVFTRIFSSRLQRAAKTAALIQIAQPTSSGDSSAAPSTVSVVQVPLLVEQDFGSKEGVKYREVSLHPHKGHQLKEQKDTTGLIEAESKESMAQRADAFLDDHLLPLFENSPHTPTHNIAIVSHGIMLTVLWKRLLRRLPPHSVKFAPEVVPNAHSPTLEHLGGWSNTGYLELYMRKVAQHGASSIAAPVPHPISNSAPSEGVSGQAAEEDADEGVRPVPGKLAATSHENDSVATPGPSSGSPSANVLRGWQTTIETVNGRDHLKNFKRTRGGVGSSKYDASQKSLDSFFKKRRIG